jgi:exopolyphosphatase/guanosine-5'-triphosphate,3'-diphosphate pyrophosphatase
VATSSVREAGNADAFLDRILMAVNLEVEIIDPPEESRLTVSAVLHAVDGAMGVNRDLALIADVGGGSALLTLLDGGEIAASESYNLGSIRMQEVLSTSHETPQRAADLLRHQIGNAVSVVRASMPLGRTKCFLAVGGDARFAARQAGKETDSPELHTVDLKDFDRLVARCELHTAEELARTHALPFADAETLIPAMLVYQALAHATRAERLIVCDVSMRDGLLLDMARQASGGEDTVLRKSILHSARTLAEKYRADDHHSLHTATLACRLFDELGAEHGLGPRYRLLLEVASILHEVGGFVSSRSHHKHSYYLIMNSEIIGLRREELQVVALIARYHRRSCPKATHPEYTLLPRDKRMVVGKLASLLRIADGLDRGHAQQVRDFRVERRPDELVLVVEGVSDLSLERRAMASKADLFEEIFGLKVRLEEAPAVAQARPGEART